MTNKQKLLSTTIAAGLALTGCRPATPPKALSPRPEMKPAAEMPVAKVAPTPIDPSMTVDRAAGLITYDNNLSRLDCKFGIISVIPGGTREGIAAVAVTSSTSDAIEFARRMCKSYDIKPGF